MHVDGPIVDCLHASGRLVAGNSSPLPCINVSHRFPPSLSHPIPAATTMATAPKSTFLSRSLNNARAKVEAIREAAAEALPASVGEMHTSLYAAPLGSVPATRTDDAGYSQAPVGRFPEPRAGQRDEEAAGSHKSVLWPRRLVARTREGDTGSECSS